MPSRCLDMRGRLPTHPTKVYYSRSMGDVTCIVVHHSGPAPLDMTPDEAAICTANYDIHPHGPNNEEWPGCSYHVILVPDGSWAYCQSLTTISYHVGDFNALAVGVCLWGNYQEEPVPAIMIESLKDICQWIGAEKLSWCNDTDHTYRKLAVVGHRELLATTCPGDFGMVAVVEIRR